VQKRIFISYRREDTAPAAGRVYDRLVRQLSESNVFFDVSAVGGGLDFEKEIASAINRSDAALIFIGDKWLEPIQPTNEIRIWEPNDYVRAEVRTVLARPIVVLPILVAGARMPKPAQLPEDIRAITTKNALPLRHESFDDDTENIAAAALGVSRRKRPWEDKGTLGSRIAYAVVGVIAAFALMLIVSLVHYWMLARPISASVGGPVTAMILAVSLIFGGWMGLRYEARKRGLR
jgi:hypothetical protein